MSIIWWLKCAALMCRNAVWKSRRGLLPLNSTELLKTDSALGDTIHHEPVICGVGKATKIVGNNPMRRVVGKICAGRPRFGKTHACRSLSMFEKIFYQSELYEDELGVRVIHDAPELIGCIGDRYHNVNRPNI
jgi:hypothetical protein